MLGNDFLDFDDGKVILQQPFLRDPGGFLQCFWPYPLREEPLFLRDLTYWVSFQLHGEWAPGFAAVDLLLHAVSSIGVWALGRRVLARWQGLSPTSAEAAALAGAFLFAVHPIHVESVAWLSARKDVLSGVLYLAGICAWLDYLKAEGSVNRRRLYLWTGVFYVGALGSKSGCVSFPLVLVAADFLLGPSRSLKARVRAALPFVVLTAAYVKGYTGLLNSWDAIGGTTILEHHPDPVWKILPITNAAVFEQYLGRMILPLDQRVFSTQGYRLEITPSVIRALVVCGGVGLGSLWLGWKERPLGFLLAWVPLALVPFMNLVASGIIYAERYAYLSSVGICLLIGVALTLVAQRFGSRRRLALGLFVAALGLPAGVRASQLARAFHNDGTLWTLVLEQEPENYIALGNLAAWYGSDLSPRPVAGPLPPDYATRVASLRDAARAEALHQRLLQLRSTPRNLRIYGRFLERRGELEEALEVFKRALGGSEGGDPKSWLSVARVYLKLSARRGHEPLAPGEPPLSTKALGIYDHVEARYPTRAVQASFQRAQALEFIGQRDQALEAWKDLLQRFPKDEGLAGEGKAALGRLGPKRP